jgi:hypothetical protein
MCRSPHANRALRRKMVACPFRAPRHSVTIWAMARLVQTFRRPESGVYTFGTEAVIVTVDMAITAEMLRASIAAGRQLSAKRGGPIAAITIIEHGATLPGPELRGELNRTVEASRGYTLCAAQVLRGNGFWVSTVRSLLTAITMLRPGDLPRRVFDDSTPAARWAARHLLQEQAWAEQLASALRSVTRPTTQEFMSAE